MKMSFWILAVTAATITAHALAGLEITTKTITEGDPSARGKGQTHSIVTKMTASGEKARIDFVEGKTPAASEGGYLLSRDAGKTFFMVSPKDKTYMKWDTEAMMGMAGAMGGMMKMQITDPKMEKMLDEAGPVMLGYPTQHYKFRTSYQMSMSIMGFKNQMSVVKEDETWATTKMDVTAFSAWMNKSPKTQNAELDKLIAMEKGKMSGLPLKTISVQTTTDNQGKSTVNRSSTEVTSIRNVSDVQVDIPSDYQEVDLLQAANEAQDAEESNSAPSGKSMPNINFGNIMKKAMESAE